MSQRLIQPGMSAAALFRVRNARRIIGYTSRGPVWSIAGGAPEDGDPADPEPRSGDSDGDDDDDTSDNDSSDDDSDDDDEDDDEPKGKSGKGKGKGKNDDDDDKDEVVSKFKYDKLFARMQNADRRSSDLQKQLDELKDKKDISQEVKNENAELKSTVDKLTKANRDLTVRVGFFSVNTIDWQNPEAALKLLDLSDVEVDEDGTFDKRALKVAMRNLAKEHPYLVRAKKVDPNDSTGDDQPTSVGKMNGTRKGARGNGDPKDRLKGRFSVLQR